LTDPILSVRDLRVSFRTEDETVRAVRGVSFDLAPGQILGLVGESGSGKSTVAMALTALNRTRNSRFEGEVLYGGRDLLALHDSELRGVRGAQLAMIFQDPMTSLTPVHRVGSLITEVLRAHEPISRKAARARAVELLAEVGIPDPARRVDDFPHEFSGGMRQRVMIAMALACRPAVLIADEPTTALDVTIQAQIMRLIRRLQA
jgi:peptide/nickel transport system ATP-binding protein